MVDFSNNSIIADMKYIISKHQTCELRNDYCNKMIIGKKINSCFLLSMLVQAKEKAQGFLFVCLFFLFSSDTSSVHFIVK